MNISLVCTGLRGTHKPVTAASVNHYPATLYLVHICRFTGLWNVFSVELGANQIEMLSSFLGAHGNNIIPPDKCQSAHADSKMRSCLWIQLKTNLGIWGVVEEWERGCWRKWFYSLFWQASVTWRQLWSSGSCNDRVAPAHFPSSRSFWRRMLPALDSEPQQAAKSRQVHYL